MDDDTDDFEGLPVPTSEEMQAFLLKSEAQARAGLSVPVDVVLAKIDEALERMRLKADYRKEKSSDTAA